MKLLSKTRSLLAGIIGLSLVTGANGKTSTQSGPEAVHVDGPLGPLESSSQGKALHSAWVAANYRLTPAVKNAYLAFAKASALKELKEAGKELPANFLSWVDSEPEVAETVYGARIDSANVLLILRSLEIDLGTDVVRHKYTQLALAMAVVHAKEGPEANISPRPLYKLVIPTCPLKPVNTKDRNRTLDVNDYIINFLNEHFIEDVPENEKWLTQSSELTYNNKGIAIAGPGMDEKPNPNAKKVKRPLTAADVMASAALQKEFNEYMKAHGQTVQIDCGDHVIYPDRHEEVKGPEAKPILDAFHLFKAAYEAKGLLPAERDPAPTPAESCAFLIRNHENKIPPAPTKKKLPDCPINAPWPLLTLLAADTQPLREREDIWIRYHDLGELHTYGEYIGGIAQQFDFQSARRLSPYPYSYGTFQMMLKDGGVCGTMANIQVRTFESLGIPSCTAGQPGHCALIFFALDPKTEKTYECQGAQFVTGGPDKTHPHTPFCFGDTDALRDMVYYQSVAWAVNAGFKSYLDSELAYDVYRVLPEADAEAHGETLLESGLSINPYNFVLADAGVAAAATPQAELHLWKSLQTSLAPENGKPGCPVDSLYNQTVQSHVFAGIAKLPVPADKNEANAIYSTLMQEKGDNQAAIALYETAADGLPAMLARTAADFKAHLASDRTEADCDAMAAELQAAAAKITDKAQKTDWVSGRWTEIQGHEVYFNKKEKITVDSAAIALAKLTRQKLADPAVLDKPLLDQVTAQLKANVAGQREMTTCKQIAGEINSVAKEDPDASEVHSWLQSLSAILAGHETFTPANAKRNAKPVRDPCVDMIAQHLASASAEK
jgi:hypothetical protein